LTTHNVGLSRDELDGTDGVEFPRAAAHGRITVTDRRASQKVTAAVPEADDLVLRKAAAKPIAEADDGQILVSSKGEAEIPYAVSEVVRIG